MDLGLVIQPLDLVCIGWELDVGLGWKVEGVVIAVVGRVGKDSRRGPKLDRIDGLADKDTTDGKEGEIGSGEDSKVAKKCWGEVSKWRVIDEEG